MNRKKIKEIIAGAALVTALTSPVLVFGTTIIVTGCNTPTNYAATACVEYNGEEYSLFNLYRLTSVDGEEHICKLETSMHIEHGLKWKVSGLGIGPKLVKDPNVYIDLDSNEELAIEGYEDTSGYQVEKLFDYFPFEKYGSRERVVISQDEFIDVLDNNSMRGKSK